MTAKKKTTKKAKTLAKRKSPITKTTVKKATRKAAAKKTAQKPEEPLTAQELDYFANLLLIKRREIFGDVDHLEGRGPSHSESDGSGDLSNMPIHMADIGTDNYEQEFTLGLIESERQQLRDIDLALLKIQQGRYGICEGDGVFIGRARLEARPWARFCIDYARKIEQGLAEKIPRQDTIDRLIESSRELSEDSA